MYASTTMRSLTFPAQNYSTRIKLCAIGLHYDLMTTLTFRALSLAEQWSNQNILLCKFVAKNSLTTEATHLHILQSCL